MASIDPSLDQARLILIRIRDANPAVIDKWLSMMTLCTKLDHFTDKLALTMKTVQICVLIDRLNAARQDKKKTDELAEFMKTLSL